MQVTAKAVKCKKCKAMTIEPSGICTKCQAAMKKAK